MKDEESWILMCSTEQFEDEHLLMLTTGESRVFCLGLKTKTKFFDYREPFSRFYRDSGVNENKNEYRKYGNENDIFI